MYPGNIDAGARNYLAHQETQGQKAIYQERAELCLQAAREADKIAAELYQQIKGQASFPMPDPVVYDHWLEAIHASAFWTQEWLSYLEMMKELEK